MLFVSNCNGWKPGEPLKLRTDGSLFPSSRPWPVPRLLLLGMAVSCSFNDVWAWNFARGVSEVLPSPSARSQSQPGPTNWLAYQFIISFNKVDIQPRTKREKPSGSACWCCFCASASGRVDHDRESVTSPLRAKVLNLSRLAFWHFSLPWNRLYPSRRQATSWGSSSICVLGCHPIGRAAKCLPLGPFVSSASHTCLQIPQISVIRFPYMRFIRRAYQHVQISKI